MDRREPTQQVNETPERYLSHWYEGATPFSPARFKVRCWQTPSGGGMEVSLTGGDATKRRYKRELKRAQSWVEGGRYE